MKNKHVSGTNTPKRYCQLNQFSSYLLKCLAMSFSLTDVGFMSYDMRCESDIQCVVTGGRRGGRPERQFLRGGTLGVANKLCCVREIK